MHVVVPSHGINFYMDYMYMYMYIYVSRATLHLLHVRLHLWYPLQYGDTPSHLAARRGHTACVGRLLSTPGIDVNIKNSVSLSFLNRIEYMHVFEQFVHVLVLVIQIQ